MNELAVFAGAGGGILGGHLLGWRTVCAIERDAYAAQVLAQRQNDGALPPFPIWSDVRSFDGRPWRGLIDVVSGGFPCQDISAAGNGIGITGERSGLWKQMARIVSEVLPRKIYMENSPLLVGRGLAMVLGDLAEMGYDARWGVVGAADLDAPHQRDRIWIVAGASPRWHDGSAEKEMADTGCEREQRFIASGAETQIRSGPIKRPPRPCGYGFGRWPAEPGMGRVANGVANRVDRIKALGNGQVPRVAATAYRLLCTR
jgi:DNA (cytosine-5)-methyltransferase 1